MKKNISKNVSIRDVAMKAGVSVMAVSRVMNNKAQVSSLMKDKVLAACSELGYQMNHGIQDLVRKGRNGHTKNLAFVIVGADFSGHGYSQGLDGFANASNEFNYNTSMVRLSGTENTVYDLPPILRDGRCDGVLLSGKLNEKIIALIKELNKPYVVLGVYSNKIVGDSINVRLDVNHVAMSIVEELNKADKEKIAYFIGHPDNYYENELFLSFKRALTEHNLKFDQNIVYEGDTAETFAFFSKIFDKEVLPFDSIVCENYRCALILNYLLGVRYGHYGRKGIILATSIPPGNHLLPVPTIYFCGGFEKIAYQGVKILVPIIEGKQESMKLKVEISTDLILGLE